MASIPTRASTVVFIAAEYAERHNDPEDAEYNQGVADALAWVLGTGPEPTPRAPSWCSTCEGVGRWSGRTHGPAAGVPGCSGTGVAA